VHNVNDSAVVVEDAKTGEILAMDGSADYNSTDPMIAGNVNAALARRQPGSSFKPIVYATAFQMGWYPGIVLPDRKTYFPSSTAAGVDVTNHNSTYHPTDYGGGYHNLNSSILLDIANSFNIPAIKTLEFAGFQNVYYMARRFGITDIDQDVADYDRTHHATNNVTQYLGPSMAIGTAGISLLQMVGAYQVFADQGVRVPPQGILDIWDNYGHHLYNYNPPTGARVISQQIAFLMSSILSNNPARAIEFAGDPVLTMQDWDGRPVAAKTGTTDNFQDNWTIGYTPDIVVGVWSGNANGAYMKNVVGITGAAPIWHDVIEYASGRCFSTNTGTTDCGDLRYPSDQFVPPAGVIQQSVNTVNGLAGSGYTSWMLDKDVPQQSGLTTTTGTGTGNGTATPTPTP